MNRRIAGILAASAAGAIAFATPGLAGPEYKNKYPSTETTRQCGSGDTVTFGGPLKMWPPNHKMQDVSLTALDDRDADSTLNPTEETSDAVTITAVIEAPDAAGGDGGPQHDPDYTPGDITAEGDPSATVDFQLRAERSGRGEGRTYTINWVATFDGGLKECTSEDEGQSPFTVFVPHDMRGGADWK